MHRERRGWNVPLGVGLFGAAVLVGGAILAYPETRRAPSTVDVSDPIATRPFPSFPEEVPAVKGNRVNEPAPLDKTAVPQATPTTNVAPKAIGGGPPAEVEDEKGTVRGSTKAIPVPLPAPTTAATNPIAPTPMSTAPPVSTPLSAQGDGSVAASETSLTANEAGTTTSDASVAEASSAVGDAMDYSGTPAILPLFGAPGGTTTTTTPGGGAAVPVSDGGLGIPSGGGGTSTPATTTPTTTTTTATDAGTTAFDAATGVTTKINLTAPLLVPMSATSEPLWTAMRPYLHGGDFVIGRDSAAMGFSERVKTDAPTVTYVVAFESPATLQSSLDHLPATLSTIGVSAAGLNDATLTTVASKVHSVGRKLFVSTNVPPNGPSLAAIGQRADVVELVIPTDVANNAKLAIGALGAKPMVFVRLPGSASTNAAVALSEEIVNENPKAGVALPLSDNMGAILGDYRSH
jgi:hypothetical protein